MKSPLARTLIALIGITGAGCARQIPAHLLTPELSQEGSSSLQDEPHALDTLLRTDPWSRYLSAEERDLIWAQTPEPARQELRLTLREIEQDLTDPAVALWRLERSWTGTPIVPLTRAYRVRWADARWSMRKEGPDSSLDPNVALLTNLTPGRPLPPDAAPPWAWLGPPAPTQAVMQHYADLWALRGWLHHPSLYVKHVARGLTDHARQPLVNSDEGQWILARASEEDSCHDSHDVGWDLLIEATSLALQRAAADRDHEQAAWSDRRAALQQRLNVTGEPVDVLLDQAWREFLSCAQSDKAAGAALVVLEARRWNRGCTEGCAGLDRMFGLQAAGTWHSEVAPLAHSWRVVALKEALDTMDVGHDTVLFPVALFDLVDVVTGLRGDPVGSSVLQLRHPTPALWNQLGARVNNTVATDWRTLKGMLDRELHQETTLALQEAPPALQIPLNQILARTAP